MNQEVALDILRVFVGRFNRGQQSSLKINRRYFREVKWYLSSPASGMGPANNKFPLTSLHATVLGLLCEGKISLVLLRSMGVQFS